MPTATPGARPLLPLQLPSLMVVQRLAAIKVKALPLLATLLLMSSLLVRELVVLGAAVGQAGDATGSTHATGVIRPTWIECLGCAASTIWCGCVCFLMQRISRRVMGLCKLPLGMVAFVIVLAPLSIPVEPNGALRVAFLLPIVVPATSTAVR
jgi:hypothetical protein